jgi:acetylornithine/N-succinyldiaminopimelate aminotransferase
MLSNRQIFLQSLAQTSDAPLALEIESASGIELFTPEGRRILDLISGISVSNLGHSRPEIVSAVQQQAAKHMHLMVYGELVQSPQSQLAALLTAILPDTLNSIYLVNSGSEAVEGALKIAKKFTGRTEMVSFFHGYHGSTHGALSVMGCGVYRNAYLPLLPGVTHLAFDNPEELNEISEKTACVIIEPVQAEAGVRLPSSGYLKAVRKRCDETGALLIFDEIQTGMGRTGSMFYFEQSGVVPDILLLAKAFGSGMPLGAFIASKEIMEVIMNKPPLGHITTFGGHPVCCAAACAGIRIMQREPIIQDVEKKGALFQSLLSKSALFKEIRRAGLLLACEMESSEKVQHLINYCLEHGLLLDWFLFDSKSIRIAPPLIISNEEIEEACSIMVDYR